MITVLEYVSVPCIIYLVFTFIAVFLVTFVAVDQSSILSLISDIF